MRTNAIVVEQLRYKFTPEEHLANTADLVGKFRSRAEMEDDHKAIKANLKEQTERVEADIGRLVRLCGDGFDMREVQCRWDFGRPTPEQKTLVRLDTGDDVPGRVERMLDHERQQVLKFETPSHVLSGPGSHKDRKVNELADSDVEYFASRDVEDLIKFGWIQVDIDAVFEEARRRAAEKATPGPVAVESTPASTAEVADASASVHDSGVQFVAEAIAAEAAQQDTVSAGCIHCDEGIDFSDAEGLTHSNGEPCPVGIRNQRIAKGEPEDLEPANTLPSARAAEGGTHAARRPRRGRTGTQSLPSDSERAALEAAQESATIEGETESEQINLGGGDSEE